MSFVCLGMLGKNDTAAEAGGRRRLSWIFARGILFAAVVATCAHADAPASPESQLLGDAVMASIFKRLSSTRSAVLLDAPAEKLAQLGAIYLYRTPPCDLLSLDEKTRAKPVSLFPFDVADDLEDSATTLREPRIQGSYYMTDQLAADIAAGIDWGGREYGISAAALKEALVAAQVSFRVVRKQIDYVRARQIAEKKGLSSESVPPGYEGMVIPYVTFALTDLSFRQLEKKRKSGSATLGLLNGMLAALRAAFSVDSMQIDETTVSADTSVVFAMTPYVARVRHATCE